MEYVKQADIQRGKCEVVIICIFVKSGRGLVFVLGTWIKINLHLPYPYMIQ